MPSLNCAKDDSEAEVLIRLIETVDYVFDNYYKDAQRLSSRENYLIDKYKSMDQCLEQVSEGRRSSIEWWEEQKKGFNPK